MPNKKGKNFNKIFSQTVISESEVEPKFTPVLFTNERQKTGWEGPAPVGPASTYTHTHMLGGHLHDTRYAPHVYTRLIVSVSALTFANLSRVWG